MIDFEKRIKLLQNFQKIIEEPSQFHLRRNQRDAVQVQSYLHLFVKTKQNSKWRLISAEKGHSEKNNFPRNERIKVYNIIYNIHYCSLFVYLSIW